MQPLRLEGVLTQFTSWMRVLGYVTRFQDLMKMQVILICPLAISDIVLGILRDKQMIGF